MIIRMVVPVIYGSPFTEATALSWAPQTGWSMVLQGGAALSYSTVVCRGETGHALVEALRRGEEEEERKKKAAMEPT